METTPTFDNDYHYRAAFMKAQRAMIAFDKLADLVASDPDLPAVHSHDLAIEFLHDQMFTAPAENAAGWWSSLAILDAHIQGLQIRSAADLPTYNTSKTILAELIETEMAADPADPFAGLAF